jgi:3-oxoacyl-[acyl-carrier protein] reductase
MTFRLSGHVALVTGSTAGLGKAIATRLGQVGARVCVNYSHDTARAERAFAEIRDAGVECILLRADVTSQNAIDRLFRETATRLGNIDIVVVNAAPSHPALPLEQYDWGNCQRMIEYFVKSPFLLTKAALPHMKAQRWGRIVNIVSDVFHRSTPSFIGYVAAKGGQVGWSRAAATELAPYQITVNMVVPGWIPVERHQSGPQHVKDEYSATIPAKRWGVPQDVADAVLYLASEEASFVTGQTVCVNGGLSPW